MAENINFISATELPEATGEEVSVLCLENGEMKQKPSASLVGKEYDMRIRYNSTGGTYDLIDGTYQQVVSKIINDVYPTVYLIKIRNTEKYIILATATYYPDTNIIRISGDGLFFNVHPDNTIQIID